MMHDRSGNKLGEKTYEERIIHKVNTSYFPLVCINKKRDLLESKETDGQRQDNIEQAELLIQNQIDVMNNEISVFVITQQTNIEQCRFSRCFA